MLSPNLNRKCVQMTKCSQFLSKVFYRALLSKASYSLISTNTHLQTDDCGLTIKIFCGTLSCSRTL